MATRSSAKQNWIGFDLGGTKMLAVVYDDAFNVKARKRRKTKAFMGAGAGVQRITETIRAALDDAQLKPADLAGIGFGCPGPLDPDAGILLDLPNLGWKRVELKAEIEKVFGCPVTVANDVDAGTYGEYRFGAARGARCVLGVFPGTGIGGGCVYDGRIMTGKGITSVEIGHVRGCLETVASRLAISAAVALAAYRGEAPYVLEHAGMDISNIRSGTLAEAVKAGDRVVEQILADAAAWLGIGIATAVNLLAPDTVILGGGLVEAMPGLFLKRVEETVRKRVMPSFSDRFRVAVAALGDDATARGAAAWARALCEPHATASPRKRNNKITRQASKKKG
jgi:glucokinase